MTAPRDFRTMKDQPHPSRRARPQPKPTTPERLHAGALFYLERFATSSANLRRVLMRRVNRSALLHGTDPAEGALWVEALIARFVETGLLNDAAYAEAKVTSLHRRGTSKRLMAAKLAAKGVDRDLAQALLNDDAGETRPGGDLAAAAALARRRRMGPYRSPDRQAEFREKDLAAFARTGFSRRVAERILACPDPASVLDLLEDD
jgi:regulatory protein